MTELYPLFWVEKRKCKKNWGFQFCLLGPTRFLFFERSRRTDLGSGRQAQVSWMFKNRVCFRGKVSQHLLWIHQHMAIKKQTNYTTTFCNFPLCFGLQNTGDYVSQSKFWVEFRWNHTVTEPVPASADTSYSNVVTVSHLRLLREPTWGTSVLLFFTWATQYKPKIDTVLPKPK